MKPNVKSGFYIWFIAALYFIWCELYFLNELVAEKAYVVSGNHIVISSNISISSRTKDQFTHFIILPIAEWLNSTFQISKLPVVTPNLITGIHCIIGIICGRLVACLKLTFRRAGVLLFLIRCILDSLDGIVYRSQTLKDEYESLGYIIDTTADTIAGVFILIGLLYRLNKYPPVRYSHSHANDENARYLQTKEKLYLSENSYSEEKLRYYRIKRYSKSMINYVGISFGFTIFLRGILWDYYNEQYYNLLMSKRSDISVRQQAEVLTYKSTWLSLWLWKVNSGDAFMLYAIWSIYFDRLWAWMYLNIYFSLPSLIAVCMYCQLHLSKMRQLLGVER